jgi:hypothetical protein
MLHDEEARRLGSCGFANVVQPTDMWMIEHGNRASFAFEPLSSCGIGGKMPGQNLDATMRSRRVSRALLTSPIPPAPISRTIS